MRFFFRRGVVLTAAMIMLLPSSARMQAQGGGFGGGGGRQRGAGGGGGGFAGGQRVQGTVTAATGDKITIKTDAGDTYDVSVTSTTRIMKDRQQIKLSEVKPGDSVTATGTVDATKKTVQAMMVNAVDAATVAKAKENLGKTYITGSITAIDADNLKLTIARTDGVSQVIQVDEGTSFQRGTQGVAADVEAAGGMPMGGLGGRGGGRQGAQNAAPQAPESITLADIKVGDSMMAAGNLKGGVFTPTKMGVAAQGAGGAGRRRADAQPAPPGTGSPPAAPPPN